MTSRNFRQVGKFICSFGTLLLFMFLSSCMDLASNESKEKKARIRKIAFVPGQVYTMRGLGGVFSRGMNRLEDTLENDYHVRTSSTIWYKVNQLSDYIIKHYRNKTLCGPIVLIGHSLGANEQIKVAAKLAQANVPVDLLMTVDAVAPVRVPPNVKEVFNIYKPSVVPMFSGITLKPSDKSQLTNIDNFNVTVLKGVYVNHFTIDKHQAIQKIMLDKVLATLKNARGCP